MPTSAMRVAPKKVVVRMGLVAATTAMQPHRAGMSPPHKCQSPLAHTWGYEVGRGGAQSAKNKEEYFAQVTTRPGVYTTVNEKGRTLLVTRSGCLFKRLFMRDS
eukprot:7806568-Pyramimonas_sp.AAC.1